ncbi:tRNA (adenosine(37)-N6)-threonylcarbamoyltransferase complex ATPase subunit type 1 TsaE [Tepidiforma flava]|uniref:tRNA threonylcarbamoyladenosine biosynthesis protein TsaE n=1 Tax=Tepidiforma flava TaxID=3004094 RepID=A0ABY7M3Z8_9CHLR|nr:tRNA (adenosine(37)-N6)-threonylcarbamoyltransferase complex ATPase subunit type 1 TsaE [Tepidiforma flava]WBL35273.1 tRNA (adenosine(37)-N6)-threonylcarbamoyltransferase complex ATPase subunit type 1 TsaE [Tepidiforma flava]
MNSPSFVLMNEYTGREVLYHVDLYRIEDVEELDELGLWDYAEKGVLVIEWPERGAELLPGDGLIVELRPGEQGPRTRRLRFIARGARGRELAAIEALQGSVSAILVIDTASDRVRGWGGP